MVAEPTATIYGDAALEAILAQYNWGDDSAPLWDFHRAAADVWEEKAAVHAHLYQFSADGGAFSRHQIYEQFMGMAHWHRSRRRVNTFAVT